jgi:phosphohistidine swiveling domain-containing protein
MTEQLELEPANPIHMTTSPGVRWTTVNYSEAIQGVQKPLGWAIWNLSMETCNRIAFGRLGIFPRSKVPVPENADERISGIFFGRAAGNINTFRRIGDLMPGSSGDILEEKLFGKEPPADGHAGKPLSARRRYPLVAAGMTREALRTPKLLPPMRAAYREWWQTNVLDAPPQNLEQARALYRDAAQHFIDVGVLHTTATLLASALLDSLSDLADAALGDRTVAMTLATGYGGMEETELIEDICAAADGRLDLAGVVRRHGYHGPAEGELSSLTWREDPAPLEAMIEQYKRSSVASPREREERQAERRRAAEQRVLSALPAVKRPGAKLTMRIAGRYIPLREVGKAAFLHALDAARCAARVGGEELARDGVLAAPSDVFFLTGEEFLGESSGDLQALVEERRKRYERYQLLTLPPEWSGPAVPVLINEPVTQLAGAASSGGTGAGDEAGALDVPQGAPPTTGEWELQGVGVVGELVTGRARIVHDPLDADLEPGDILVCATTDPSWTPLFMVADALVIDTGGAMSHGAIVARELGVTCVINTVTGTRDIPDGARLTVDGSSGRVLVSQ